jgi:hypothetical protein
MAGYDFDLQLAAMSRVDKPADARLFTRTSQPLSLLLCWGNGPAETAEMWTRNLSYEGALVEAAPGVDDPPQDLLNVVLRIGDDIVSGEVVERQGRAIRVRFLSIGPGLAEHIYRHLVDAPDTALAPREY